MTGFSKPGMWTRFGPAFGWSLAAAALLALPTPTAAVQVDCSVGGDAAGWSVAARGDFDGDGKDDLAVGSPCARASRQARAGRARIFSGAGGKLLSLKGTHFEEQLGIAVAFVGDLDGDGSDEIAVGSNGFDVEKLTGGTLDEAGKLAVFSFDKGLLFEVEGGSRSENLGESVAGLGDIDGDEISDLAVGGGGARADGDAFGHALLVSGADGTILKTDLGDLPGDRWGSVVTDGLDVDGDGVNDVVVASSVVAFRPADEGSSGAADGQVGTTSTTSTTTTTTTSTSSTTTTIIERNAGMVKVLSGVPPHEELFRLQGREDQRLGRGVAMVADLTEDDRDDLYVGAPGVEVSGLTRAGTVALYEAGGQLLRTITEPVPQVAGAFGTAVAVPGDLNQDTKQDVVASAPGANGNRGLLYAFDSDNGDVLWTIAAITARARLGQSMAAAGDYNGDGTGDVLVGSPGEVFRGRRGAGAAFVLSGQDGSLLRRVNGRRGLETRLFVAGVAHGGRPHVRSFDPFARARELRIDPFRNQRTAALSLAVADDTTDQKAGDVLLAIGTGRGGDAPSIRVVRAGLRRLVVSDFTAIESAKGGVNVAAGDLEGDPADGDGDDLLAVEAESDDGQVQAVVWKKRFLDPQGRINWSQVRAFSVFNTEDRVEGLTIGADGAHAAVGPLTNDAGEEIVVGPVAGLPVVRVFTRTGTLRAEWLAYPPEGSAGVPNQGTHVAVGDINGDGDADIVTVPSSGQQWVRAWAADGTPLEEVNFFISSSPVGFSAGLRVAVADIDFDGDGEILLVPRDGADGLVKAFETDGKPVVGWERFSALGPGNLGGLTLATTDRFLRP